MEKVKKYIVKSAWYQILLSSRPVSWVNTAYPFAAGYLVVAQTVDALFWVGTLYFLIPYNLLMYGLNDVFDYESDVKNPRKGGLEGAVLPKRLHRRVIITAIGLQVPFVVFFATVAPIAVLIALCVSLFFVVAYSAPVLRFKERPVLDSLTSSLHFVGPLVVALCFGSLIYGPTALPYVAAFFLWGVASHAFGAVQDILPDRAADIRSVATIFGARRTMIFVVVLYGTAVLMVALQDGIAMGVAAAGVLYIVNAARFIGVRDATSAKVRSGWRWFMVLNMLTGAVITVTLLYKFLI